MDKVLNVGVVGCGQIAQIMHLPYLHDADNYRIAALCDISPLVLNKLAVKYSVPAEKCFADYEAMIELAELDIVLICNKDHYGPVMKAAQEKKHILVEKPFAYNVREAKEMLAAAAENNVKILVGYMKCYDPGFVYAQEKIKTMKDITLARFHDYSGSFDYLEQIYDLYSGDDLPPELVREGRERERAGMLEELGEGNEDLLPAYFNFIYGIVHDTVLLRHLFGNEGKILYADVYHEDFITLLMDYGGVRVSFEIGFADKREIWDENIYVYSPDCDLSVHFPFPYLKNAPTVVKINENEGDTTINQNKEIVSSFQESYRVEWQHFYDCIINDQEPLTNGLDGLLDIQLASDIMRACRR